MDKTNYDIIFTEEYLQLSNQNELLLTWAIIATLIAAVFVFKYYYTNYTRVKK